MRLVKVKHIRWELEVIIDIDSITSMSDSRTLLNNGTPKKYKRCLSVNVGREFYFLDYYMEEFVELLKTHNISVINITGEGA